MKSSKKKPFFTLEVVQMMWLAKVTGEQFYLLPGQTPHETWRMKCRVVNVGEHYPTENIEAQMEEKQPP